VTFWPGKNSGTPSETTLIKEPDNNKCLEVSVLVQTIFHLPPPHFPTAIGLLPLFTGVGDPSVCQ